jgi:alkanesulfonate monooxygenase SsuD/methylene tetrahydromethanopterin reductase-like flavin-dependent oxidoreductase (luciferase family)
VQGRHFRSTWTAAPVPIYVACSGPKILRAAAQVADGLILAMGFGDDQLAEVEQIIESACAEVGRDPTTLDLWWHCSLVFAPTVEEGMQRNLGVNPGWLTLKTLEGKQIPDDVRAGLLALTEDFRNVDAEYRERSRGAALVARAKELGIYEWLVSRAPGLWGPPEHIADRLVELGRRGLANWIFYGGSSDIDRSEWIRRFTGDVVPRLGERLG